MIGRFLPPRARRTATVLLIATLSVTWLTARPSDAGDLTKLNSSLNLVPENASFFSSSMRLGEQVKIVAESRAWAKLKDMPSVKDGLKMIEKEMSKSGNPAAGLQSALEHPAVKDLVGLLGDMFSHDAFILGDQHYPDFLTLAVEISDSVQYGSMVMQITGHSGNLDEDDIPLAMLFRALADNLDAIKIPTTIVGFKVNDKPRAKKNLENLAGIITIACMAVPQLNGSFERTDVAGHQFMVLSLDGEMIPWDEVPMDELKEVELEEGDAEKVIAKLRESKLAIAIGIRDDYLLFSIGESTDYLASLGTGKLLIDRPELEPLKKFADRRLVGVGYASKELNGLGGSVNLKRVGKLLEVVDEVLPHSGLPAGEQKQIRRDAGVLVEDIEQLLPQPGAMLAFSFLTDEGLEGYSHHWAGRSLLDGSKPLDLLDNLGGNPILAAVWRERYAPENYDILARWCSVGYRYFETYALPEMSGKDRKQFDKFVELVGHLPAKLDRANRKMLMPALEDSQGAVVFDAKLKSRRPTRELPDFDVPMPLPEPAVVIGVSDPNLLLQGCAEYRQALVEFIDALREIEPDEIPEFDLPTAKVKETELGTFYSYSLPKKWKVDKKIAPTIGLSDTAAVIAVSRAHAERLLADTPLKTGGLLADPDKPRAIAFLFDFAGFVDAATPWVELAAQQIIVEEMDLTDEADKAKAESITEEVHTVLEVLKSFRKVTIESCFEDGALVTHSLTEIRDIK